MWLCVEHYMKLQAVENERQRNLHDQMRYNMAMMNDAAANMDAVVGFSVAPKVQIPSPTPAGRYTAVSVRDSTVGVINTANVVGQISSYIAALPTDDAAKKALEEFTSVVATEQGLADQERQALLDQLAVLAEQATEAVPKRKAGVIRAIMDGITRTAGMAGGLASAWDRVAPILRHYFGLPI